MQESSMSISVNGQSQVPPGFRFHPTEEELLNYYLRKKVLYEKIDLDVIRDVDLNKLEPWDIQEKCRIGSTPQNDWYFFSHKDKKYPTGTRTNRATAAGFWKATGRDKVIHSSFQRIGMRKTLVFYKGRAPHGQKSDWIMHEYRLDETTSDTQLSNAAAEAAQEEGWVVCRIFKKKNLHKTLESSPMSSSSMNAETRTQLLNSSDEGALEQIFQHMGRTCKDANSHVNIEPNNNSRRFLRPIDTAAINNGGDDSGGATFHDRIFMKLPTLESPNSTTSQNFYQPIIHVQMIQENEAAAPPNPITAHSVYHHHLDTAALTDDWAALDRLVASHLNGQTDTSMPPFSSPSAAEYNDQDLLRPPPPPRSAARAYHPTQDYNSEIDLWSFTRTCLQQSSDPLCHISNTPA